MVIKDVYTEKPSEHWQFAKISAGDIVLDFGCGRWEDVEHRDPTWPTTPKYFKDLGASKVYGFDFNSLEIQWFSQEYVSEMGMSFHYADLSNHHTMEKLITTLKPTFIKCDIEKNEVQLLNMNTDIFYNVLQYAIEVHRDWIFDAFMSEFNKRGYEVTAIINLKHADPMKVIFAERIH